MPSSAPWRDGCRGGPLLESFLAMVLIRYLNRMVLLRVAAATTAVILFALLFDLLDASDDLIRREGGAVAAFGRYFVLRFPSLLTEILPFATLLGALFAAADLMRHGELTIFWASGISPLGIILRLLPVCLLVFGIKLLNDDLLVPGTVQELRSWDVGYFRGGLEGFGGEHLWVEHAGSFIRLPRLEPGQETVDDVVILRRDATGNLTERITAGSADLSPGAWLLQDVSRGRVGEGRFIHEPDYVFENGIDVDRIKVVARPPQEVALFDLIDIVRNDGYGVVTPQGHMTAIYHRLFGAMLPMLMIMLTFAYARRVTRQGGVAGLFLKGIATGFGFVILSGMMLALAEAGFVGPLIATAGPILLLVAIIVVLPLKDERHRFVRVGRG
jgi:lipopolysaccharide export system permease protein